MNIEIGGCGFVPQQFSLSQDSDHGRVVGGEFRQ
jgi:hypothetical protein